MTTYVIPKSRRLWRIAAWVMGSMFTLLLLTLAGTAWWLWGWQWHSGMSFHESWTAEERAALTQFERYLHTQLADDMGLVYEAVEDTMEEIANEVSAEEEENDDETTDEWTKESNATPKEPLGLAARLTMAVLMIGFILLALTTRFYLAGFYKQGPTLLNVYYIANPVFNLIYLIALTAVLPASARGDAEHNLIGSVLGGVVMLILNKVYFDKRKHLFVNDIQ